VRGTARPRPPSWRGPRRSCRVYAGPHLSSKNMNGSPSGVRIEKSTPPTPGHSLSRRWNSPVLTWQAVWARSSRADSAARKCWARCFSFRGSVAAASERAVSRSASVIASSARVGTATIIATSDWCVGLALRLLRCDRTTLVSRAPTESSRIYWALTPTVCAMSVMDRAIRCANHDVLDGRGAIHAGAVYRAPT
jgi:hypothetical protein